MPRRSRKPRSLLRDTMTGATRIVHNANGVFT